MVANLLKEGIRGLVPYQPKEYKEYIRLDANENNYSSRLLNQKIAKAILDIKVNQYPDSDCHQLRDMLAKELRVAKERLLVGSGSDQLIAMVLNAFVDKGDKVLTLSPTFSMYKISNQIAGGITIEIPLKKDFSFDYYGFIKAIKKEEPKVVFITNPNNPTGGVIPREQIIKLIEHTNGVVVVDEAYYEFYGESVIDLTAYYQNLIVLRTLSKAYGLAGARVGYSIASKELIEVISRVKPPYNVSSLDQTAAKVCLDNRTLFRGIIEEIITEREKLAVELGLIKELKVYNSYGNFLLVGYERAGELYQHLLNKEIVVRCFGDGDLKDCLRISIGTVEENRLLLQTINGYFGINAGGERLIQAK